MEWVWVFLFGGGGWRGGDVWFEDEREVFWLSGRGVGLQECHFTTR